MVDAAAAKLTPPAKIKYYEQLIRYTSTAGEYSASEGMLRRKWQISNSPGLIGQESTGKYSVEGDRLLVELRENAPSSIAGHPVVGQRHRGNGGAVVDLVDASR